MSSCCFFFNFEGMEESQVETIDTICQNIQLLASIFQEYVSKDFYS